MPVVPERSQSKLEKMAYENFMCNKDFHPSNFRNLKKARFVQMCKGFTKIIDFCKLGF